MAINTSEQKMQALLDSYWERILRALGLPADTSRPPIRIVDNSDTAGGNAAEWDPNTGAIEVSRGYLRNSSPDDLAGMLVHEGTHAAGASASVYQGHKRADRWAEPVADALRYRLTGTTGGWQPSEEAQRLADLNTTELKFVHATLASGQWTPRLQKMIEDGEVERRQMREALGMNTGGGEDRGVKSFDDIFNDLGDFVGDLLGSPGGGGGGGGGIDTTGFGGGKGGDGDKADKPEDWEKLGHKEQRLQETANFRSILIGYGIPIGDEMNSLVQHAYNKQWNQAMFMEELRGTRAYRQRFPGIFDNDGTMKMDESTYMQTEKLYQSYASKAGLNMGPKRMAWLFRNNVDADEFADRAVADARIARNKQLYGAFKRELVQGGVAKPSEVNTDKELFKFVMGEGNKAWADLWQDSITRYAANQAGITIAKNRERYTAIGQKAIEKISGMGLSEEDMASRFTELASVLGTVLPLQEADLYGVKKRTGIAAIFGGKNSERARQKIQRAIETDEAFYEQRATNQVYSDEAGGIVTQGVTDRRRQQVSEY